MVNQHLLRAPPMGIMEILEHYKIDVSSMNA